MGKKVVFVDDSQTVLMSSKMIVKPLVDSGVIEFFEFENPLDFLEKVKKEGFIYDLVITDVNMPQMNGLDMAKELKSIPELKLKPILALTTENSPEKKQLAKEIGLAGWITKPFSPEKLLMGIKRVLKIR